MILCNISNANRFESLSPQLKTGIHWAMENYDRPFERGTEVVGYSPAGNEIIAKWEETVLLPREKVSLETHCRYIDIQLPLKGSEIMGWAPTSTLKLPRKPYDSDADVTFYGDAATSLVDVKPGQMAIFFPEDAHAPNIGLGNHRKIIVKVPVE